MIGERNENQYISWQTEDCWKDLLHYVQKLWVSGRNPIFSLWWQGEMIPSQEGNKRLACDLSWHAKLQLLFRLLQGRQEGISLRIELYIAWTSSFSASWFWPSQKLTSLLAQFLALPHRVMKVGILFSVFFRPFSFSRISVTWSSLSTSLPQEGILCYFLGLWYLLLFSTPFISLCSGQDYSLIFSSLPFRCQSSGSCQ